MLRSISAFLFAFLLATSAFAEVKHPRVYLDGGRLDAIRKAIATPGSHHAEAFAALKARVDKTDIDAAYHDHIDAYKRSYRAQEAAFISLVATDRAVQKKYADIAFEMVMALYKQGKRRPDAGYGLSRAQMSLGLALPYDWCYNEWSADQRAEVKKRIEAAADGLARYGHANLSAGHRGSNWVAVVRGGELTLLIAGGLEKERAKRYDRVKRDLITHMKNGYGSIGVSQEGSGYAEYGGRFLLGAVLAARSIGDDDPVNEANKHAWWKWLMYAWNFQPHERKFLQSGVAHSTNYDEGFASMNLALVPDEQSPYFVYWYDHHMGRQAPGGPQERFDSARAGTIHSILWYPTAVKPKDPTGVFPAGVADDHGYYFFRNRWKDADDVLTSMHADAHHHSHAWDQPECGAINVMGFNTRFIGGPGKDAGGKRDKQWGLYSALLVDGKYFEGKSRNDQTGKPVHFEADKDGGYAIVDGAAQYAALGVSKYQRHMRVRFLPNGHTLIAVLDEIESDSEHTYTWQANVGSERDDVQTKTTAGTEGDMSTVLLTSDDGFTKIWAVSGGLKNVNADGDPVQFEYGGTTRQIMTLMYVGNGTPPKATVADGSVKVGGVTVTVADGKVVIK